MNAEPASASRADRAALLFAITFPSVLTWVYFVLLAESAAGLQLAAKSSGMVIQIGFPLFWFVCMQKQRLSWSRPKRDGLLIGGLLGLAIVAAMFGAYHLWLKPSGAFDSAAPAVIEKIKGMGIDSTAKFAALSVFYAVLHSLLEEYYWRWFVFAQLRRVTALGPAIAISALGFMAHHVIVLSVFFGEGIGIHIVARERVIQVGVPVDLDGTRDVPGVVQQHVLVTLGHNQAGRT